MKTKEEIMSEEKEAHEDVKKLLRKYEKYRVKRFLSMLMPYCVHFSTNLGRLAIYARLLI